MLSAISRALRARPAGAPGSATRQAVWTNLRRIERRQWWLWISATIVTLLLTAGMFSFTFPFLFGTTDSVYLLNLHQAIRGLVGLVLLFDVYSFYQQIQIYRMRRQLAETQRLFHLIGENAADLIAVVEPDGRRLYNSPSYEKILGYSAQELKQTSGLEQIHPDDRAKVLEAAEMAAQTGVGRTLEYRFRHKDGTWRTLESTASAVRDSQGGTEMLVIVNRDITERKQAEETLRQRDTQLRQVQRMEAVGRLSGGIAHDFNNLLTVIIGYSEVMETEIEPSGSPGKRLQEIKKAAQSAASLTSQLLAFSRQQVIQPKILELNVVVADMNKMLRRLIGENIELTAELEPSLGKIKADRSQIEQVILNLAVNARDAMFDGGSLKLKTSNVEVDESSVQALPYLMTPGPYVQLTVTDNGAGMDIETQSHIFEPFFTTKEVGKGTGLGLATVYGVIKQSNGFITVRSKVGEGTSFTILFPQIAKPVTELPKMGPWNDKPQMDETILLVEDEGSIRQLMAEMLGRAGFRVLSAADPTEAIEVAANFSGPIHLLLTDVIMPGVGGVALSRSLLATRPDMKVLFVTGYLEFNNSGRMKPPADAQILQKPFTHDALLNAVHKALATIQVPTLQ
jgi:PAS domain S-box-containing protein